MATMPVRLRTPFRAPAEPRADVLTSSEARFRQAFDDAAIGMALVGPGGELMQANAALAAMLGRPVGQLEGLAVSDIIHPDDVERLLMHVRQALVGAQPAFNVEKRFVRADGSAGWALFSATVVRDDDGAPLYLFSQIQDLTARREAEAALERRDAVLEGVAQGAGFLLQRPLDECATDVLRLLGEAAAVSRASLMQIAGPPGAQEANLTHEWTADGVVPDLPQWQAVPTYDGDWVEWYDTLRRGEVASGIATQFHGAMRAALDASGIRSILEVPVFVGGELWGAISLDDCFRDRTWMPAEIEALRAAAAILGGAVQRERAEHRLRESEELLRQSQKLEAVGRLAGGIAHDFNNLLTVITGYSGLVLDQLRAGDPLRHDVGQIADAAERAVAVTGQLLAFSRRQMLQPRAVDLNQVVAETESMLVRLIGEDVRLSTRLDPHLCLVLADPGQLEQVIVNLVVNARDAMPGGGTLTISTGYAHVDGAPGGADLTPGRYAALSVVDTGSGMDAETRTRAFEPFFTTKEKGRGTGLGLATVYGIVKQTGGDVVADSAPGRGTTFTVFLPLDDTHPALEEPASPTVAQPEGDAATILLAEDEDVVRELLFQILAQRGYRVLAARDGEEALTLASQHAGRIDLLVTDVVMPRLSGRELAERLEQRLPDLRVLFLSGYTDDAVVRHGVIEHAVPFLQKPFTAAALADAVRGALA
jgi:PAS domain S-box-containing protein